MSGEEQDLIWDTFPEAALLKPYNVDRQTPDSAGTATAYWTGVKTNFEVTQNLNIQLKVAICMHCLELFEDTNTLNPTLDISRDSTQFTGGFYVSLGLILP